eukprot:TRINITY_DN4600_c0_g1_i3.p1 TRINITY_DN4600_c0_g1~~TRINITY_DN4600_c0_g1_i3.p1  ORF type:complete len:2310 (+),score=510.73 TRINITY_DN4600_c0_g1_i3:56-6931(+)
MQRADSGGVMTRGMSASTEDDDDDGVVPFNDSFWMRETRTDDAVLAEDVDERLRKLLNRTTGGDEDHLRRIHTVTATLLRSPTSAPPISPTGTSSPLSLQQMPGGVPRESTLSLGRLRSGRPGRSPMHARQTGSRGPRSRAQTTVLTDTPPDADLPSPASQYGPSILRETLRQAALRRVFSDAADTRNRLQTTVSELIATERGPRIEDLALSKSERAMKLLQQLEQTLDDGADLTQQLCTTLCDLVTDPSDSSASEAVAAAGVDAPLPLVRAAKRWTERSEIFHSAARALAHVCMAEGAASSQPHDDVIQLLLEAAAVDQKRDGGFETSGDWDMLSLVAAESLQALLCVAEMGADVVWRLNGVASVAKVLRTARTVDSAHLALVLLGQLESEGRPEELEESGSSQDDMAVAAAATASAWGRLDGGEEFEALCCEITLQLAQGPKAGALAGGELLQRLSEAALRYRQHPRIPRSLVEVTVALGRQPEWAERLRAAGFLPRLADCLLAEGAEEQDPDVMEMASIGIGVLAAPVVDEGSCREVIGAVVKAIGGDLPESVRRSAIGTLQHLASSSAGRFDVVLQAGEHGPAQLVQGVKLMPAGKELGVLLRCVATVARQPDACASFVAAGATDAAVAALRRHCDSAQARESAVAALGAFVRPGHDHETGLRAVLEFLASGGVPLVADVLQSHPIDAAPTLALIAMCASYGEQACDGLTADGIPEVLLRVLSAEEFGSSHSTQDTVALWQCIVTSGLVGQHCKDAREQLRSGDAINVLQRVALSAADDPRLYSACGYALAALSIEDEGDHTSAQSIAALGGWQLVQKAATSHAGLDRKQRDFCAKQVERLRQLDPEAVRHDERVKAEKLELEQAMADLQNERERDLGRLHKSEQEVQTLRLETARLEQRSAQEIALLEEFVKSTAVAVQQGVRIDADAELRRLSTRRAAIVLPDGEALCDLSLPSPVASAPTSPRCFGGPLGSVTLDAQEQEGRCVAGLVRERGAAGVETEEEHPPDDLECADAAEAPTCELQSMRAPEGGVPCTASASCQTFRPLVSESEAQTALPVVVDAEAQTLECPPCSGGVSDAPPVVTPTSPAGARTPTASIDLGVQTDAVTTLRKPAQVGTQTPERPGLADDQPCADETPLSSLAAALRGSLTSASSRLADAIERARAIASRLTAVQSLGPLQPLPATASPPSPVPPPQLPPERAPPQPDPETGCFAVGTLVELHSLQRLAHINGRVARVDELRDTKSGVVMRVTVDGAERLLLPKNVRAVPPSPAQPPQVPPPPPSSPPPCTSARPPGEGCGRVLAEAQQLATDATESVVECLKCFASARAAADAVLTATRQAQAEAAKESEVARQSAGQLEWLRVRLADVEHQLSIRVEADAGPLRAAEAALAAAEERAAMLESATDEAKQSAAEWGAFAEAQRRETQRSEEEVAALREVLAEEVQRRLKAVAEITTSAEGRDRALIQARYSDTAAFIAASKDGHAGVACAAVFRSLECARQAAVADKTSQAAAQMRQTANAKCAAAEQRAEEDAKAAAEARRAAAVWREDCQNSEFECASLKSALRTALLVLPATEESDLSLLSAQESIALAKECGLLAMSDREAVQRHHVSTAEELGRRALNTALRAGTADELSLQLAAVHNELRQCTWRLERKERGYKRVRAQMKAAQATAARARSDAAAAEGALVIREEQLQEQLQEQLRGGGEHLGEFDDPTLTGSPLGPADRPASPQLPSPQHQRVSSAPQALCPRAPLTAPPPVGGRAKGAWTCGASRPLGPHGLRSRLVSGPSRHRPVAGNPSKAATKAVAKDVTHPTKATPKAHGSQAEAAEREVEVAREVIALLFAQLHDLGYTVEDVLLQRPPSRGSSSTPKQLSALESGDFSALAAAARRWQSDQKAAMFAGALSAGGRPPQGSSYLYAAAVKRGAEEASAPSGGGGEEEPRPEPEAELEIAALRERVDVCTRRREEAADRAAAAEDMLSGMASSLRRALVGRLAAEEEGSRRVIEEAGRGEAAILALQYESSRVFSPPGSVRQPPERAALSTDFASELPLQRKESDVSRMLSEIDEVLSQSPEEDSPPRAPQPPRRKRQTGSRSSRRTEASATSSTEVRGYANCAVTGTAIVGALVEVEMVAESRSARTTTDRHGRWAVTLMTSGDCGAMTVHVSAAAFETLRRPVPVGAEVSCPLCPVLPPGSWRWVLRCDPGGSPAVLTSGLLSGGTSLEHVRAHGAVEVAVRGGPVQSAVIDFYSSDGWEGVVALPTRRQLTNHRVGRVGLSRDQVLVLLV